MKALLEGVSGINELTGTLLQQAHIFQDGNLEEYLCGITKSKIICIGKR